MNGAESEAFYDQVRAHVAELQQQLGAGFGDQVIAGLTRAERGTVNRAAHKREQLERATRQRPTLRQKQLLWALGYRGPVPANRAEVAALPVPKPYRPGYSRYFRD